MSWERTERTLQHVHDALPHLQTPEQCQTVGSFCRDALISLAQAVFRPEVHWRPKDPAPSPTDSKRQLESYLTVTLAGASNEEIRSFARSAVQLADALTHKRMASPKDARVAAIATEFLIRLVAELEDHRLSDSILEWQGISVGQRYFAWDGPQVHALDDRSPIAAPHVAINAFKAAGHNASFTLKGRLVEAQARGAFEVYETARKTWRRELLHDADGNQVLIVVPRN